VDKDRTSRELSMALVTLGSSLSMDMSLSKAVSHVLVKESIVGNHDHARTWTIDNPNHSFLLDPPCSL